MIIYFNPNRNSVAEEEDELGVVEKQGPSRNKKSRLRGFGTKTAGMVSALRHKSTLLNNLNDTKQKRRLIRLKHRIINNNNKSCGEVESSNNKTPHSGDESRDCQVTTSAPTREVTISHGEAISSPSKGRKDRRQEFPVPGEIIVVQKSIREANTDDVSSLGHLSSFSNPKKRRGQPTTSSSLFKAARDGLIFARACVENPNYNIMCCSRQFPTMITDDDGELAYILLDNDRKDQKSKGKNNNEQVATTTTTTTNGSSTFGDDFFQYAFEQPKLYISKLLEEYPDVAAMFTGLDFEGTTTTSPDTIMFSSYLNDVKESTNHDHEKWNRFVRDVDKRAY